MAKKKFDVLEELLRIIKNQNATIFDMRECEIALLENNLEKDFLIKGLISIVGEVKFKELKRKRKRR